MRKFTLPLQKIFYLFLLLCLVNLAKSQTPLEFTDFAVWGGSASPGVYNSSQGVFIGNTVSIQGSLGSNHLVDVKNNFTLTGSIFSGNAVSIGNSGTITGNIFAARSAASYTGNVIYGDFKFKLTGNLTANGKIFLQNLAAPNATTLTGQAAVPAPTSTNYSGPAPTGGIVNVFTLPVLPSMPNNTVFDNEIGTTNITSTQTISPGKFRKLSLTGNKILTFNGPGNYIFMSVDNGVSSNKLVFDFKNTSTGTINIFVIRDAIWGKLSVSTINGNFPSRIYTEVHGDGSSTTDGSAFSISGADVIPAGSNVWLGNVWAPNAGISVKSLIPFNAPHIIGALWSAKKVNLEQNLKLVYEAPAIGAGPAFIDPYYPPPATGKVTTANNVIGAELLSLSQNTAPITSIPENEIFVLDNAGKVMIEVVSKTPNNNVLKLKLKNMGMTDTVNNGPHTYVITGYFPIDSLSKLNGNSLIEYVRPLYPPISNMGQVTTQGDTTMRSYNVRKRFGLDGSGVKIGVISDSYNSKLKAQDDIDQGDLPGIKTNGQPNENPEPVQVLADIKGNDEGRAMLQIVHDVAPKSKLAFRTGFYSAGDFAKGIQELASPSLPGGRCDVIVDDITYVTEPFLRDGIIARAVDDVVSQGVTYFSSAGNFGNKSYEADFNGVTNTSVIPAGEIHKFGTTAADIYQTVNLKPGTYTIVLQWSDKFHSLEGNNAGTLTDLDLYLVGANGFTLFGFNRSNISGDPFEVCPFKVREETNAKLMVVRAAGNSNVRFKYIIFRGEGTIIDYQTGTSSIVGHPNANGAIAIGAMLYANIPPFTPVWPGVASFSSRGGTPILENNAFVTRNKPDLIGPNGVNTTVNLGGTPFNDGDPYPNFFGTSAAAPHVAAVGALLIQGRKKFNLQSTVLPSEIRAQLQTSAGKFSYLQGNHSFEGGYGYVQADSAILQIANARPIIDSLKTQIAGAQNGTDSFIVVIKGKYLTDSTKIYVNGMPVVTNVSGNKTQATAKVPDILPGEDPPFQLFNAAKSPSGEDGGLSEALHFFSSRIDVTITAVDTSRKYGQSNPGFRAEIRYNGELINHPDTLVKLKLDNLIFTTIATPTSNTGLYSIVPSRNTALPNNDPLLLKYGFTFVSGTLTVEKMRLKITPQNKQIKYGEYPGDIVYNYELDQPPANPVALQEEIKTFHKKYLADNGLIVISGFNSQNPAITQSDLDSMSTMASFQSVRNARKFVLENGQLKPVVNNLNPSQIGDQRFIIDVSAQSLHNYKLDPDSAMLVQSALASHARGFLNLKALANGNAKALFNGQLKPMVNGQLLAMVNGQLQAVVNGQLKAMVNGILITVEDIVFQNGQLLAMVNGVWTAVTNGQLLAVVNGQSVTVNLSVANGQLQAVVNGQAMTLVNGQLQAVVNGQLLAVVNGQLKAVVNGQLMPMVNGQLMAVVNGQLLAVVNGQLQAMVNGQLMAVVNGELQIVQNLTLSNGQLQAVVNGQLQAVVNGQLKAMVNGVVTDIPTTSFSLVNGQLQAVVNGQLLAMVNGQLLAVVNGELQPLVNSFEAGGTNSNAKTLVLVDQDDITIQSGDVGGMFSVNMITGLNAGIQTLIPGGFVNENFEVTYGLGHVTILPAPLITAAKDTTKVYGDINPIFTISYSGLAYGENAAAVTAPVASTTATNNSGVGTYPITLTGGGSANYSIASYLPGTLTIGKKTLNVTANDTTRFAGDPNPSFRISYSGLVGDDTKDSVCIPYVIPPSPKVIDELDRRTTYTNVKINDISNVFNASPGQPLRLKGGWSEYYITPGTGCTGCITQLRIGMANGSGGNVFATCDDVSFQGNHSGSLDILFNAPSAPGVYYITQISTWWYTCPAPNYGDPPQVPIHNNGPNAAIAVVVVNVSNTNITASTNAGAASPVGNYPIILQGCNNYNPNYNVILHNGTLTVTPPVTRLMNNTTRPSQTQATERATERVTERRIEADRLYPNPAFSMLRLELKDDVQALKDIKVYDGVGKLNTTSFRRINNGLYEINVSGLPRGIYIIEARTAAGIKTFKFIKM